jgi:hypothetical protein
MPPREESSRSWDAPPYSTEADSRDAVGPVSPTRPVRVKGEFIEPQVRRTAELAEMNGRLAARTDDAEALIHRGWLFIQQKKMMESGLPTKGSEIGMVTRWGGDQPLIPDDPPARRH